MAKNDQKWPKMGKTVNTGKNRQKWAKSGKNRQKRPKWDKNRQKW